MRFPARRVHGVVYPPEEREQTAAAQDHGHTHRVEVHDAQSRGEVRQGKNERDKDHRPHSEVAKVAHLRGEADNA